MYPFAIILLSFLPSLSQQLHTLMWCHSNFEVQPRHQDDSSSSPMAARKDSPAYKSDVLNIAIVPGEAAVSGGVLGWSWRPCRKIFHFHLSPTRIHFRIRIGIAAMAGSKSRSRSRHRKHSLSLNPPTYADLFDLPTTSYIKDDWWTADILHLLHPAQKIRR